MKPWGGIFISIFAVSIASACNQIGSPADNRIPASLSTPQPIPTSTTTPAPIPTPAISPRPSSAGNITVCPSGTTTAGLDVDDGQTNIQWTALLKAEIPFAIVKATEGLTFINPYFVADWAGAKAAGMVRGAYHYFRPEDDGVEQAKEFLSVVGTLASDDLPPALDWEVTDDVSSATQIERALDWLSTVEQATGKTPMVYTYIDFWNELGNPQGFEKYPLWIAYTDAVTCPLVPPPWSNWVIWQYNTSEPLTGVTADAVDRDKFNGTVDQMFSF